MIAENKEPVYGVVPGSGDLPKLELATPGGTSAQIYLQGAHIVSWVPAGDKERMFLSRASQFRHGAPIRGGVPVVFPQFGASGPLPLHGLASLMPWEIAGSTASGDRVSVILRLKDTEESRSQWPHPFLAELTVSIGGKQLDIRLLVTNTGESPFDFTTSFHTYLSVADIFSTTVEGLAGLRYRDAAAGGVEKYEDAAMVNFTGEVNRIYFDAPPEARLVEQGRTTIIRKVGFTDTVVWNPGEAKCATMPDLEPDDYRRFVCVEAATVGVPVHLEPGERWEGSQVFLAD